MRIGIADGLTMQHLRNGWTRADEEKDVSHCDDSPDVKDATCGGIHDFNNEERERILNEHTASFGEDGTPEFFD